MSHPTDIDGHRVLEFLGQGGMGCVYRVESPTGAEVALKLLRPVVGATRHDLLRFKREFALASALNHPNLVGVHALGFFHEQPYYTMDLVRGRNLREDFAARRGHEEGWIRSAGSIVTQLLEGVVYIHRHGVLHRDLKPENVLVDDAGRPRLLDFGLARRRELGQAEVTEPGMVLGTLHYISPEQVSGRELDLRADLFSLGVVLYEVLTGYRPFDHSDPVALIMAILNEDPPPPRGRAPWVPERLEAMLVKLLRKEPAERYQSASELLHDWTAWLEPARVAGGSGELPAGNLFAPRFVGREAELAAFIEAAERGSGVVLVEGVSGVGKTRFLQEAAACLRRPARPLHRAQAGGPGRETPYHPWLDLLRRALGAAGPPAGFEEALAALFPELGKAGAEDPEDPRLKFRLYEAMARLLGGLAGREGLVLVLEDLHAADPATLDFFPYLARAAATLNLVLVGSYRSELLPAGPPGCEAHLRVALEPLTRDQTRLMVRSMLGCADLEPDTAHRLFLETEGNPMFVEEVLRTLVAQPRLHLEGGAWRLEASATGGEACAAIPASVREVLESRLMGLDPADLELAVQGALLGLSFEFEVLARVAELPGEELIDRLDRLVGRRVLREPQGSTYSFCSQPMLEVLEARAGPTHHARAAAALEDLPQPNPVRLAHHYRRSGQGEKAVRHLLVAAEAAFKAFSHREAVELYGACLDLPEADRVLPRRRLRERLADARDGAGLTAMALEDYQGLLPGAEGLERARMLRKMAACWEQQGEYGKAYDGLKSALRTLGAELPSDRREPWPLWCWRALQLWLRRSRLGDRGEELERCVKRTYMVLYYMRPAGWKQDMLEISLRQRSHARESTYEASASQSHLLQGYALTLLTGALLPVARRKLRLAAGLASEMAPDTLEKSAYLREVTFLLFSAGDVDNAVRVGREALDLALRAADVHGLPINLISLQILFRHQGRLTRAWELGQQCLPYAEQTANPMNLSLCYSGLALLASLRRDRPAADGYLAEAVRRTLSTDLSFARAVLDLVRGWNSYLGGDFPEALTFGRSALAECRKRGFVHFEGECNMLLARVLVELCAGDEGWRPQAVRALRRARRGPGRIFPIFEATLRRLEGDLLQQRDRKQEARLAYLESLQGLAAADNPLEQGHTHTALSRHYGEADRARAEEHRRRAQDCFQRAGVLEVNTRTRR